MKTQGILRSTEKLDEFRQLYFHQSAEIYPDYWIDSAKAVASGRRWWRVDCDPDDQHVAADVAEPRCSHLGKLLFVRSDERRPRQRPQHLLHVVGSPLN